MRTHHVCVAGAISIALAAGSQLAASAASPVEDPAGSGAGVALVAQPGGTTRLVSVRSDGHQTRRRSHLPSISVDGRFVAFTSRAGRLIDGEVIDGQQIYLRDTKTGLTTLVSRARGGAGGNGWSDFASISADGSRVVYHSSASDLVRRDRNHESDAFLYNVATGRTSLVSQTPDGRAGNRGSSVPVISADGTHVVFTSSASDLTAGGGEFSDIFVRDLGAGTTELVTVAADGGGANYYSYRAWISGDGQLVSFRSGASNLVSDDTNSRDDAFLCDLETGSTILISRNSAGLSADGDSVDPVISADGRRVVYFSYADDIVSGDQNRASDVFAYEVTSATTTLVSMARDGQPGNADSYYPMISGDGKVVGFTSVATNLVSGDTNGWSDVFARDLAASSTVLASVGRTGEPADGNSDRAAMTGDGSRLAFESTADNLVRGDRDLLRPDDVFVRRLS